MISTLLSVMGCNSLVLKQIGGVNLSWCVSHLTSCYKQYNRIEDRIKRERAN